MRVRVRVSVRVIEVFREGGIYILSFSNSLQPRKQSNKAHNPKHVSNLGVLKMCRKYGGMMKWIEKYIAPYSPIFYIHRRSNCCFIPNITRPAQEFELNLLTQRRAPPADGIRKLRQRWTSDCVCGCDRWHQLTSARLDKPTRVRSKYCRRTKAHKTEGNESKEQIKRVRMCASICIWTHLTIAKLWHFAYFLYGVLKCTVWICLWWCSLTKNTPTPPDPTPPSTVVQYILSVRHI